jgi:tetratricopeptide (TPR) repeat protein
MIMHKRNSFTNHITFFFAHNMKKTIVVLFAFFAALGVAQAQPDGAKLAKSAGKALTSYNLDPSNNRAKLDEAKNMIEQSLATPEGQALVSAYITKGDIYSTIVQSDMTRRMLDKNHKMSGENDALVAYNAYKMAFQNPAAKKYEKSDAIKGVGEMQSPMVQIGAEQFDLQQYDKAYMAFAGSIDAHELLKSADKPSIFDEKGKLDEQVYYTALAATLANKPDAALPLYERLYKNGTDKPDVYSGLYKAYTAKGDKATAEKILTEGRKKFPDDSALLFDEINEYLQTGRLDELTGRLKEAIAKEPTNIGLYVTLGNVYDNLNQMASKNKDAAKMAEYSAEASKYYTQALERDPKNPDANYAMGALYYNQAAIQTQELNALPEDFSAAGMKKYEAMKDGINKLFDQALPYFQKSESVAPNDINTLIALTEIYVRKEDETLSAEFKKRMETVKSGGKNAGAYFK